MCSTALLPHLLSETAATGTINVYGQTKLAGELACRAACPESIIIRTSWVYSSFGANFVKTMSRLMQERDSLSVVNDQIGSPPMRPTGASHYDHYHASAMASRALSCFQRRRNQLVRVCFSYSRDWWI